jgi:hypothetical protein
VRYTFGEPLSDEQKAEVQEALEQSARTIKEHQEKQKLEPRRIFIQEAIAAGFTESQAEFLWFQRLSSSEWKA